MEKSANVLGIFFYEVTKVQWRHLGGARWVFAPSPLSLAGRWWATIRPVGLPAGYNMVLVLGSKPTNMIHNILVIAK